MPLCLCLCLWLYQSKKSPPQHRAPSIHPLAIKDNTLLFSSDNWLKPEKHQLCWSHVKRNLQQIADYTGRVYTALVGQRLTLIANMVFRIRHRLKNAGIQSEQYIRRMNRLRKSFDHWLQKGSGIVVQIYKGRCKKLQLHRQSLWLFCKRLQIDTFNHRSEHRNLLVFIAKREMKRCHNINLNIVPDRNGFALFKNITTPDNQRLNFV